MLRHLRRAEALFEQAGFAVQPVGADDRSFPSCRGLPCWVPSAAALEASGLALKEVPGGAVQVRRGWGGAAGAARLGRRPAKRVAAVIASETGPVPGLFVCWRQAWSG